ncbi:MAG: endonuclease/exonuclease/phosphatase family protein [Clostridiales bacterium]|nr:endonuclease/exonuclease/phosphatase family protein [Clostridiales bacterium]
MKFKGLASIGCAILAGVSLIGGLSGCKEELKPAKEEIDVMSFNIRTQTDDDKNEKNWSYRYDYVKDYILNSDMDVVCLQEVRKVQFDDLKEGLSEKYEVMYFARENGTNPEGLAICYLKTFDKVESDMFWLSETPDKMSLGWGANYYRICAYAKFRTPLGGYIDVFNVHLDHQVELARTNGLNLILDKVEERGNSSIVCGDFNTTSESECYTTINSVLYDCQQDTANTDSGLTYQNWGGKVSSQTPIDFCFVSENIKTLSFDIMQDTISEGVYYSDHYAINAKLEVTYEYEE